MTLRRVTKLDRRPLGLNFEPAGQISRNYCEGNRLLVDRFREFRMKIELSTDYPRRGKVRFAPEPTWTPTASIP